MKDGLSEINSQHEYCYQKVLAELQKLLDKGKTVIVSIDGRCGSGKSGLAEVIRKAFTCNVFHMDDYYLPMDKREENWEQIPGGNIDFERFKKEVLMPTIRGEAVTYRPYDCRTGTVARCEQIKPCILTVVEGSYSAHPLLSDKYDIRIFLTCSEEVQKMRLMKREGEKFQAFELKWIPLEENYFKCYNIEKNSTMVIDTGELF